MGLKKRFIQTILPVTLRAGGTLVAFGANVAVVRFLSVAEFGRFGFALAVATILSGVAGLGLQILVTRETAILQSQSNATAQRNLLVESLKVYVPTSFFLSGTLFIIFFVVRDFPIEVVLAIPIMVGMAFLALISGFFRGLNRPYFAEIIISSFRPLTLALAIGALLILNAPKLATSVIIIFDAALMLTVFLAVLAAFRALPHSVVEADRTPVAVLPYRGIRLLKQSGNFFAITLLNVTNINVMILAIFVFFSEEQTAIFRVGFAFFMLVAALTQAVVDFNVPKVAALTKSKNLGGLRKMQVVLAGSGLAISIPAVVFLALVGKEFISLVYGSSYEAAYSLLLIMMIGPVIRALMGSPVSVLQVSHFENLSRNLQALILAVQVGLGLPLMVSFGIEGAAIGYATGDILASIVGGYLVWRRLGVRPGVFSLLGNRTMP